MSAWYVWSALGMYPVTPGSDQLILGTPLFDRAIVTPRKEQAAGEVLTIRKSGSGIYIRNAHIEENELPTHITKDAMRNGGTLVLNAKTNQVILERTQAIGPSNDGTKVDLFLFRSSMHRAPSKPRAPSPFRPKATIPIPPSMRLYPWMGQEQMPQDGWTTRGHLSLNPPQPYSPAPFRGTRLRARSNMH